MKLICAVVFVYAKCWFSYDVAQISLKSNVAEMKTLNFRGDENLITTAHNQVDQKRGYIPGQIKKKIAIDDFIVDIR